MDSNPDRHDETPQPQPPEAAPVVSGWTNPTEPGSAGATFNHPPQDQFAGPYSPPPPGSGPPPTVVGFAHPGASGPNWAKRWGAAATALAVLVAVGFVGYRIGVPSSSSSPQATQSIPKPAASSGVTAKTGTLNVSAVTAKVEPGVVDITAVDGYANATSAGTGMVLTSNGEVLTNNHVIDGATSITVQVDGVGAKYPAKVVGYDVTQDIALLQIENASGLQTITVGNSSTVAVGLPVVAIGNALDLPGRPTVTSGAITALGRSITASDQGNSSSENLTGLLQSDASLCSGNSGGPLANSAGQVVGMNTAAATASASSSCSTVGFAIPINRALTIASAIQQGQGSSTVHLGLPAFLGVDVQSASSAAGNGGFGGFGQYTPPVNSGALVTNVFPQTAAATVGLVAGDVITVANGSTITSEASLGAVISAAKPGQSIALTWVDSSDNSHNATVTLGTGPAQ